MKCPTCAAASEKLPRVHEGQHSTEHFYLCDNGHRFKTLEVHPTMVADARELHCAVNKIQRRVALWHRDSAIAADPRPTKVVAADYDITDARVRQIRASFRSKNSVEWAAKILTQNSERKS